MPVQISPRVLEKWRQKWNFLISYPELAQVPLAEKAKA